MTTLSNTDPARIDLYAVKGDVIDMTFHVNSEGNKFYVGLDDPADGTAHNLGALQIQVRRKDGLKIKEWLSGVSPSDIVVNGNEFRLVDDGFDESGFFDYDVEEDSSRCIMRGTFHVEKEITI
jgi:hypothetical protein